MNPSGMILGRFENWLIDRRGLNLGDVVPFRSQRLPGPNSPVSDGSQTSMSEGEEPFISASSMASKAASLPKNVNGSKWEPSSSKATAGEDQAILFNREAGWHRIFPSSPLRRGNGKS